MWVRVRVRGTDVGETSGPIVSAMAASTGRVRVRVWVAGSFHCKRDGILDGSELYTSTIELHLLVCAACKGQPSRAIGVTAHEIARAECTHLSSPALTATPSLAAADLHG